MIDSLRDSFTLELVIMTTEPLKDAVTICEGLFYFKEHWMQWFKHDSNATTDAKIRKLILRHGPTGYAVYFQCLELIASSISSNHITFELEHDAEIIADNLKIKGTADRSGVEIVGDIMRYMVELRLFEESDGRIFCFKMLKRLDQSMTSNKEMRKIIQAGKEKQAGLLAYPNQNHDGVMIES